MIPAIAPTASATPPATPYTTPAGAPRMVASRATSPRSISAPRPNAPTDMAASDGEPSLVRTTGSASPSVSTSYLPDLVPSGPLSALKMSSTTWWALRSSSSSLAQYVRLDTFSQPSGRGQLSVYEQSQFTHARATKHLNRRRQIYLTTSPHGPPLH